LAERRNGTLATRLEYSKLTLPTAQAGRFSGYARPSGPRSRLRGVPLPTLFFTPQARMFRAALWSLWRLVPQCGHACHRADKPVWTPARHPEQAWLVNAGGTATARFPAHTALNARMPRNSPHPASAMDFARQ